MRDRQILLGLRDFARAKTRPLNIRGLSDSVIFGISPLILPNGKIIAIRVQDIAKQLWFNYDNGVWDKLPECTVGENLSIAAYAENVGDEGGHFTLTIFDDVGAMLAGKGEFVEGGSSMGVETGTRDMPDRAYDITVKVVP